MQTDTQRRPDPAHAREARSRYCAERALEDPRRVRQAARIVRAALAHGDLTIADVDPDAAATG